MIENWQIVRKWLNYLKSWFYPAKTVPPIITLSITEESKTKLQGTQNGWFQWQLSDNKLNRIEHVDTIESLLKRHKAIDIQRLGIEHIVIIESGQSDILQQLIAEEKNDIKIIFRHRFPADVVSLLCEPDADILATWQEICQNNSKEIHRLFFKNRTLAKAYGKSLAKAYGKSLKKWFETLNEDDLKHYKPARNRVFSIKEFTYIEIQEKVLVFALTAFPSAWFTLKNGSPSEIRVKANYAGAFIEGPKLKLFWGAQQNWDELNNSFWMKWLKHFKIPKNDLEKSGFIQKNRNSHKSLVYGLRQPMILIPGLASIAIPIVFPLYLIFQSQKLFVEFNLENVIQEESVTTYFVSFIWLTFKVSPSYIKESQIETKLSVTNEPALPHDIQEGNAISFFAPLIHQFEPFTTVFQESRYDLLSESPPIQNVYELLPTIFQEEEKHTLLLAGIQEELPIYRGGSHNIPLSNHQISYQKGYNYKKLAKSESELALFWQLGQWTRFLHEGCKPEKSHLFNPEKQSKIVNQFIQAFEIYEPYQTKVIGKLNKIQNEIQKSLSQNDISQDDLCNKLAEYNKFIFNKIGSEKN